MRPTGDGIASAAFRNAPVCVVCLAAVVIYGLSSKETGLSIGGPAVRARELLFVMVTWLRAAAVGERVR